MIMPGWLVRMLWFAGEKTAEKAVERAPAFFGRFRNRLMKVPPRRPLKYYLIAGMGFIEMGSHRNSKKEIWQGARILKEGRKEHVDRVKKTPGYEMLYYGLAVASIMLEDIMYTEDHIKCINGEMENWWDVGEVKSCLLERHAMVKSLKE